MLTTAPSRDEMTLDPSSSSSSFLPSSPLSTCLLCSSLLSALCNSVFLYILLLLLLYSPIPPSISFLSSLAFSLPTVLITVALLSPRMSLLYHFYKYLFLSQLYITSLFIDIPYATYNKTNILQHARDDDDDDDDD
ncbi:hypothetical protein PNOK_0282500 [Pyrrhoderma noxium]|uniref:Uncharacterized protein n=1 Tax=Pyrrhoderma noxium TaxID=2282107 RepID=A0A286UTG4_9AGAM|nr:hypothetical protein PNOK_0282500 [Pyrrhoderma noxium]